MIVPCEQRSAQSIREDVFHSVLAERNELYAENSRQREQIAILEEQLERERERSTRYYMQYQNFVDWTCKLFANNTIPEACKLVLWYFWFTISSMRASATGEELRIGVEDCAQALGISTSTVRKATDKAEMWEVLKRDYEPITLANGDKRTLVHISLNDVVSTPEDITMEKRHGGARVRKCPKCGSEDVDRYTVQYCRCCDENAWYGQPGLRADADVIRAQNAQNTMTHERLRKQDAFEDREQDQAHHILPDQAQSDERLNSQPPKKQDAFERLNSDDQAAHISPAQLATEHTSNSNHGKLQSSFGSMEMNDPRCRMCGSRHQIYDESISERVCAECWTPQHSTVSDAFR